MKIDHKKVIKVGMAEWKLIESPNTIRTSGLGSCVGVVVYDQWRKKAVLAHIMLPDSTMARHKQINRAKFADTAIEDVVAVLLTKGCSIQNMKAKIAGGAQMFSFSSANDIMKIGPRNAEAVKNILRKYHIPVTAEDIGGNKGRTIEFDPEFSTLHIRTVNQGEAVI
ncbi:chemotaxis protein CheD [Alteribacillus bidgolensis]|uniref:Probable chemoreceptor glutamine deamidase CheD n=1 Tax=Alteribacillus bidgolensis TaxID=930129 RepID=A0A1G8GG16_9BACI|nr:chemotaxis protein CheD [Alteribacillus bidgolensis]SDH93286.1 chemotaxis protein CheD [Alteribacillus bidgolensis]